jgi:two-component system osmolarity sensor histidine kinase EnvZ
MKLPNTLFFHTAIALTITSLLLVLATLAATAWFVLIPVGKQAADDLAALLILSAQTWVEIPPETRPDLEQELFDTHSLRLTTESFPLSLPHPTPPYLTILHQAIERRIGHPVAFGSHADHRGWYWVDFSIADHSLRFGFTRDRIGASPPFALLTIAIAILVLAIATALIIALRLSRPLALLSAATSAVGRGEKQVALPESGPDELKALAGNFNQMSKEVTELLENRTTLLAGLSHDLRTPLTRMRLALELLPANEEDELYADLRHDVDEMDQLLRETLLLARGVGHGEPLQACDLGEIVSEVVEGCRQGNVPVKWEPVELFSGSVPTTSLKRVLGNLLENAIRYGSDQPVTVELKQEQGHPVIRILDRGPGIPDEMRMAVFRPFQRLENSRSTTTGGSGLGLAIVQQLCNAQGWEVSLQPRGGGGTVAVLRLKR